MTDSFFALCVCAFAGGDGCLTCNPGELLIVYRVEKSGWAGAQSEDGRYGWMPWAYAQHVGDEAAAVLEFLAPEFRLGAYRDLMILQGTATNTMEGYASPDSDESDALGEEWTVGPKQRRPSRVVRDDKPRITRASLDDPPRPPSSDRERVQFADDSRSRARTTPSSPPPLPSQSPSGFSTPRVRGFRLRSKSADRSGSETTRARSLRRTRMSMFGATRAQEPHPADEIARLAARPKFLQPTYSPVTGHIVIDADGSIRAGTLEAIAERLTCDPPSRSYEAAFRRAVLITYEAFTTSNQLFDLITDQYSLEPARELSENEFIQWKEARLRPTQARVLEALGMWLLLPRLYQDDPEIVLRIREFLQLITEPDNLAADARDQLRIVEKLISPASATRSPTPQRQRRKTFKPQPFPTLSPSHRASSSLLSPTSPRLDAAGAGSPRLSPQSLGGSSSMTSLPSSLGIEQTQGLGQGQGVTRAKSQRNASGSYFPDRTSRAQHTPSPSQNTISSSQYATSSFQQSLSTSPSQRTSSRHSHAHSDNSSWHGRSDGSRTPSGVLSLDPTALAHHLTLLEARLYMRVRRLQCLEWHLVGKASKHIASGTDAQSQGEKRLSGMSGASTNGSMNAAEAGTEAEANDLRDFCATSDRLAGWVKWSVLSLESSPKRAEAIGLWIRVAEKCRLLNNLSSLCAVVAALSSADVSRLSQTWHHVPNARVQRLEDLARLTSPAGNFTALKVVYTTDGPGVPFVGMYLTALVHASDQFKDFVPAPGTEKDQERRESSEDDRHERGGPSEPATPTQTHPRSKALPPTPSSTSKRTDLVVSARAMSPSSRLVVPPSPTVSTLAPRTLLNFTKRHKQADIIGAMLKFQMWPYEIASVPGEPLPPHPSSSPPTAHLSPASPPTSHLSRHQSNPLTTAALYPYTPSSPSSLTTLHATAGGVAWVEEQLARAARVTLGSDWTYERSMQVYDEEMGVSLTGRLKLEKELMGDAGF
ncbi:ras GEF [Ceratobasidium sp. AG-I]|nr:ras GEF [Ceratobasidium sp. AG-I]